MTTLARGHHVGTSPVSIEVEVSEFSWRRCRRNHSRPLCRQVDEVRPDGAQEAKGGRRPGDTQRVAGRVVGDRVGKVAHVLEAQNVAVMSLVRSVCSAMRWDCLRCLVAHVLATIFLLAARCNGAEPEGMIDGVHWPSSQSKVLTVAVIFAASSK